MDLEFHEKGDGINLAIVWNESLETRESERGAEFLEEGVGSTITPSEIGGPGLRSLWVLEPPFTTRTHKRRKRSIHTEWRIHTRPGG